MSIHSQQLGLSLQRPTSSMSSTKANAGSIYHVEEKAIRAPNEDRQRQSRHNKSNSLHYTSDGLSMRRQAYARAKSVDAPVRNATNSAGGNSGGGRSSLAALKAAQLSAHAHHKQDQTSANLGGSVRSPYLAAASKAWSNSAAKSQQDKADDSRSIISRADTGLLQPLPIHFEAKSRKSTESVRPLQSEFLLPTRSGGKHSLSDLAVQEVNQFVNAEVLHQGPLLAARISFAQDREAHAHDLSPPSRPSSTHPIYHEEIGNRSSYSLHPWSQDRHETPPPTNRNADTSRAALSAASLTWASHENDNPRPSTPASEPYQYITHNPRTTLRNPHKEELGKFLKHGRIQPMSASDRKRYEGLWAANKGLLLEHVSAFKDEVASIVVRDIWERSRLQAEILADIYDLVDHGQTGRLTRDEFVVGTWLVDHSLRGRRLPFKRDMTDDVFESGPMARLGIKTPKKLKHDEKKYLRERKEKPEKSKKKK